MKPVKVIRTHNDCELFEKLCEEAIKDGYMLTSSNCSCNGECSDETYQAIMALPEEHVSSKNREEFNRMIEVQALMAERDGLSSAYRHLFEEKASLLREQKM